MKITSLFLLAVCGLGAWSRLLAAPGAARGYDATGRVAALVKFGDRSQAVISIQVP